MSDKISEQVLTEYNLEGVGLIKPGDSLEHPIFGVGIVENIYELKDGSHTIRLNFSNYGSKALVPEFAKLSKCGQPSADKSRKSVVGKLLGKLSGKNT